MRQGSQPNPDNPHIKAYWCSLLLQNLAPLAAYLKMSLPSHDADFKWVWCSSVSDIMKYHHFSLIFSLFSRHRGPSYCFLSVITLFNDQNKIFFFRTYTQKNERRPHVSSLELTALDLLLQKSADLLVIIFQVHRSLLMCAVLCFLILKFSWQAVNLRV